MALVCKAQRRTVRDDLDDEARSTFEHDPQGVLGQCREQNGGVVTRVVIATPRGEVHT
jgi:hypothetical protein